MSTSVVGTPQDEHGVPVSLLGQLASVALFDEALTPEKVAQLYSMGNNNHSKNLKHLSTGTYRNTPRKRKQETRFVV